MKMIISSSLAYNDDDVSIQQNIDNIEDYYYILILFSDTFAHPINQSNNHQQCIAISTNRCHHFVRSICTNIWRRTRSHAKRNETDDKMTILYVERIYVLQSAMSIQSYDENI